MDDRSKKEGDAITYVVAVSGGIDSVVLLDILVRQLPPQRLTVAHFDHGIRDDSTADRHFVGQLAKRYDVAFAFDEGRLGAGVSEAAAREARYAFLRHVKQASHADYIVTAHHEDDVFETAVLNLLRGTGRKGLSSLGSQGDLYRPLLKTPKAHIQAYAAKHGLQWHEDSTNSSPDYLRNYIRINIMPKFDEAARSRLRQLIASTRHVNVEIDGLLAEQLHLQPAGDVLDRQWFIMLPHAVAKEIIAAWLRRLGVADFDRKLVERLTVAAKTFEAGKQTDINARYVMVAHRDQLVIQARA